jgi:hypothetical protein
MMQHETSRKFFGGKASVKASHETEIGEDGTTTYLSNAPGAPLSLDVRELILPEYLLMVEVFCFAKESRIRLQRERDLRLNG